MTSATPVDTDNRHTAQQGDLEKDSRPSARSSSPTPSVSLSQPVPLSPLRPIFVSLAVQSTMLDMAGADLVGLTIEMDLPELGAAGTAVITEILPAPRIERKASATDERRVVTATFRHPPSHAILDVTFADERVGSLFPDEQLTNATSVDTDNRGPSQQSSLEKDSRPSGADTISVTSNHLFWSVDRQEFVEIGEMEVGERVQTFHGETKRIASKLPRPGPPEEVFNLEVHGEHVYFVGDGQILAHNSCAFERYRQLRKAGWGRDSARAIVHGEFGAPTAAKAWPVRDGHNPWNTPVSRTSPGGHQMALLPDVRGGNFRSWQIVGNPRTGLTRPSLRAETVRRIYALNDHLRNPQGQFFDQFGVIEDIHLGHIKGHENRRLIAAGEHLGISQAQLNDFVNAHPQFFQIERASINLSRVNELPGLDQLGPILRDMRRYFAN